MLSKQASSNHKNFGYVLHLKDQLNSHDAATNHTSPQFCKAGMPFLNYFSRRF